MRREVQGDQLVLRDRGALMVLLAHQVLEVLVAPLVHPDLGDQVVVEEGEVEEVVVGVEVVGERAHNTIQYKREHSYQDNLGDTD